MLNANMSFLAYVAMMDQVIDARLDEEMLFIDDNGDVFQMVPDEDLTED